MATRPIADVTCESPLVQAAEWQEQAQAAATPELKIMLNALAREYVHRAIQARSKQTGAGSPPLGEPPQASPVN
jgi:hypothetical protein